MKYFSAWVRKAMLMGLLLLIAGLFTAMTPPLLFYATEPIVLPLRLNSTEIFLDQQTLNITLENNEEGIVKGDFVLINPSDDSQTVRVALPYLASLSRFDPSYLHIETEGIQTTSKFQLSDYMDSESRMGQQHQMAHYSIKHYLDDILSAPSQQEGLITGDTLLTVHQISVTAKQGGHVTIDLEYDPEKTVYLYESHDVYINKGWHGEDDDLKFFLEKGETTTCYVYVIGEDILSFKPSFEVDIWSDEKQMEDPFTIYMKDREQRTLDSLLYHKLDLDKLAPELDDAIRHGVIMTYINKTLMDEKKDIDLSSLEMDLGSVPFTLSSIVDITVPANDSKTLSVQWPLQLGMDLDSKENYEQRFFTIMTEPLKTWGFSGISKVKVTSPEGIKHYYSQYTFVSEDAFHIEAKLEGPLDKNIFINLHYFRGMHLVVGGMVAVVGCGLLVLIIRSHLRASRLKKEEV